jgi:hypothetical protein
MFGLFAKQAAAKTVSPAERAAAIAKVVATLGTQYRSLKAFRTAQ